MKINRSLDYKQLRARAYPTIEDQLDILYHSGYDAWRNTIAAVKLRYPKPSPPEE